MSRFSDLMSRVTAEVDAEFGDRLLFVPWRVGKYTATGTRDATRAERQLIGTFGSAMSTMSPGGDTGGFRGEAMPVEATRMSFALVLFPDPAGYPQEHDRIIALDQPGEPTYAVSFAVADEAGGRLYVRVARA